MPADLLAAMSEGRGIVNDPFVWLPLNGSGKQIGLFELSAAVPLDPERGGIGRRALDEPMAHGVGGLEADTAASRAFAQGQHEHEAFGIGHTGFPG